jgi:hypothetical protein
VKVGIILDAPRFPRPLNDRDSAASCEREVTDIQPFIVLVAERRLAPRVVEIAHVRCDPQLARLRARHRQPSYVA